MKCLRYYKDDEMWAGTACEVCRAGSVQKTAHSVVPTHGQRPGTKHAPTRPVRLVGPTTSGPCRPDVVLGQAGLARWPSIAITPVIRTGPDRPVRPVKSGTGASSGPGHLKNRTCMRTGENRSNHRFFISKPVENRTNEPLWTGENRD